MKKIKQIKNTLIKNISNVPGSTIRQKVVVFLVDDWGSIRIPNVAIREKLSNEGIDMISNRFNRFDTMASPKDLSLLFEVLEKHRDRGGNPANFTAMSVVANPDFGKIKESGFTRYFSEAFTTTLNRYYGSNDSFNIWKQGISAGVFSPQFHGREHLNVEFWLDGLRNGDKNLLKAFENEAIGVTVSDMDAPYSNYIAAFDLRNSNEVAGHSFICSDGIQQFNSIFGYKPLLFTSSSLIHHMQLEKVLAESGIRYIDRAKITREPQGNGMYKKSYFRFGQTNVWDQKYITRNCMFEPNDPVIGKNAVEQTLNDIAIAFRWNKPAIVSSHRVNFVGELDQKNRINGLQKLDSLLQNITKNWPDVQFMSFQAFSEKMDF